MIMIMRICCNIWTISMLVIGTDQTIIYNRLIFINKMARNRSQLLDDQPFKVLLIKLTQLQIRPHHQIASHQSVYYSFSVSDRMYFSSLMDANELTLSDDIIIPLNSSTPPQCLELHRWENHMIMFTHEIDLSDLKTRTTVKKKQQTRAGQILSFMVILLNEEEMKFGNKLIQSITQHYLVLDSFQLKNQKGTVMRDDPGPSFFRMKTSRTDYAMPVIDGQICVKLPETLQFQHIRNGELAGRSRKYKSDELTQSPFDVSVSGQNGNPNCEITVNLRWGINLSQAKAENTLLLDAQQLLIYDMEVKFDNFNEFANCKLKFIYGNKAFQASSEFNSSKPTKIKKIIHFIIKSEDEEINIVIERNLKAVAQSKLYTEEIESHTVNSQKKKLMDVHGKSIGYIKFKCEKAKNLSTPANNKFWKESNKKKLVNTLLLSFSQFSVNYECDEPISMVVKTSTQEKVFPGVPNFQFFQKNQQVSSVPIVVSSKPQESVYLMVKNRRKEEGENNPNDFIGIAILNFAELRLGINSVQVPFFKNQVKSVSANCMINKVTASPFLKSTFQPQMLHSHAYKALSLSVFMKKVQLSPYLYTFRYDNKNEVYCIVEANRLKKVLIMESTAHNELIFVSSASSDSLNFIIEDTEYIKVKVTFLVSDIGHEQEIYGSAVMKMKTTELENGMSFNKIDIKNEYGMVVGQINTEVNKGSLPNGQEDIVVNGNLKDERDILDSSPGVFKSDIKRVKKDVVKIQQNMRIVEKSIQKAKSPPKSVNPIRNHIQRGNQQVKKQSARYDNSIIYGKQANRQRNHSVNISTEGVHFPTIKNKNSASQNKNSNLIDLIQMMKIRKRSTKGTYEQNSTIQSYNFREDKNQRNNNRSGMDRQLRAMMSQDDVGINISKEKIERENPNLQRNLEILFPKKAPASQKKEHLQRQIDSYEEKLRGLKSVYQQIGQDMEEIEPSLKNSRKSELHSPDSNKLDMVGPEWEDNEFAVPN